jgi:hypothetical protein
MNDKTKIPSDVTATKKLDVTKKLRDIALEDLDAVTGGTGARCDMDGASSLAE